MVDRRSDERGSVQVLEAVLVAILMLAAVSFVLTFSLPSNDSAAVRDQLQGSGDETLAILYDLPLNDPAYGNSTMSKYVGDAFQNNPGNLTRRLNMTLTEGVAYSVYIDNGYGSLPVYNPRDPAGETVTVSRLFEPRWSYTWLLTDVDHYTGFNRMGVYGLPVIRSLPLTDGGAPVEVSVKGQRLDALQGNTRYTLTTSHSVVQENKSLPATIPHATITFINATGEPVNYVDSRDLDDVGGTPATAVSVTLRLNETAGVPVPAGTKLTVHAPRGWKATADDDATWDVLQNATDTDVGSTLVAELKTAVSGGTADFQFDINFTQQDRYDIYAFRARLGSPAYGAADLVVHRNRTVVFEGGDFPEVHVTAPKSMGQTQWGVWTATVTNPVSSTGVSRLRVDEINVVQPDGDAIFGKVADLREAVMVDENGAETTCYGNWTRADATTLRWTADDSCILGVDSVLHLAWEVKSVGVGTPLNANDAVNPPVAFDNDFQGALVRQSGHGLYHQALPPDLTPGEALIGWDDTCPLPSTQCSLPITSKTVHNTIPLEGRSTYETRAVSVNTFRDALALSDITLSPRKAPLGETVTITSDVKPLLHALREQDLPLAEVHTSIYPPWAIGKRIPVEDPTVHSEASLGGAAIEFVETHDLNGDGHTDVLVVTAETKVYGLDGRTGVRLTGYVHDILGQQPTSLQKAELTPGATSFIITTTQGTSNVHVLHANFTEAWAVKTGSGDAMDAHARFDFTGDGVLDVSVGGDNGNVTLLNGANGTELWREGRVGSASDVEQGYIGENGVEATVATMGPDAYHTMRERALNQTKNNFAQGKVGDEMAEQLKRPTIHLQGAAIRAFNGAGQEVWNAGGGGYNIFVGNDIDGNGITDIVAGDWNGVVDVINGSQATTPWSGEQIASGSTVREIHRLDRDHVYTISQDGVLMWTNDSWTNRNYYAPVTGLDFFQFPGARGVEYVDTRHGWVTGQNHKIWQTTNGDVADVSFSEVNYKLYDKTSNRILLTTADFVWEDIYWVDTSGDHTTWDGFLYGGDCRKDAACGDGFIARTENGGDDWVQERVTGGDQKRHVHDLQFISYPSMGYAVGENGAFYQYDDGGLDKWKHVNVESLSDSAPYDGSFYGFDVRLIAANNTVRAILVGEEGTVYRGWNTMFKTSWAWESITVPTTKDLRDVEFADEDNGIIVGKASTVLRTFDGGDTWVSLEPAYADSDASGIHLYDIALENAQVGYFAGGSPQVATRLIGYLHSYEANTTAQTLPLMDAWDTFGSDLKGITSATIDTDASTDAATSIKYELSNDGCSTWVEVPKTADSGPENWGASTYEEVDFPNKRGGYLCLRINLTVDTKTNIKPALVRNVTITYDYKLDSGPKGTRTFEVDLTDWAVRDISATTADWTLSDGTIRPRLINKFWIGQTQTRVTIGGVETMHGSEVLSIDVADLTRDGAADVVVGTGDAWLDPDVRTEPLGEDRRIYLFNGTTGQIEDVSAKLPGVITALKRIQLTALTGDSVPDLIVGVHDPNLYSDPNDDTWSVVALNGSDLTDVLWSLGEDAAVNDITRGDLDSDGLAESVYVTDEPGTEPARAVAHHPEADTDGDDDPDRYWLALPDLTGKYSQTYAVPMNSLYGPYIVETEVVWVDTDDITQKARLYDYFVVTPPNGKIPVSPVYRVDLVLWYEDWG